MKLKVVCDGMKCELGRGGHFRAGRSREEVEKKPWEPWGTDSGPFEAGASDGPLD